MKTILKKSSVIPSDECMILLAGEVINWSKYELTKAEISHIQEEIKNESELIAVNQYHRWVFVYRIQKKPQQYIANEVARKAGERFLRLANRYRIKSLTLVDTFDFPEETLAFAEGMVLGNYSFLKYKKKRSPKEITYLDTIHINSKKLNDARIGDLQIVTNAVCKARDLVNEPVIFLTAVQLAKEFQKLGKEAGFHVEVFNKTKIQSLKMGGLLAVNMGSIDPPTFTIMEWKPKKVKNSKPIVLVGKGIVYDTGGLSLKPTHNSMDTMKSDMGGAAAVAGTLYAIAKADLPVHVIGLVPSTDNRPDGNAYTPGDIITMYNGTTVEVLNTDAEGRLILGDALSYASKYKPELVIDLATLTGSAANTIGHYGIVCMGNVEDKIKNQLKESGNRVYERLAEMPFWDEYADLLKSDIADLKNIGGPVAGAITAGKFLSHFVDYPWMHFDIAGPAFLTTPDSYRGRNATGVGIRLLFDFLSRRAN